MGTYARRRQNTNMIYLLVSIGVIITGVSLQWVSLVNYKSNLYQIFTSFFFASAGVVLFIVLF